jgi:hypothetical protein
MKKAIIVYISITVLIVLLAASCSMVSGPSGQKLVIGNDLDSNMDLQGAREVARLKLEEWVADPSSDGWDDSAELTTATPVYMAGIEAPSYYEFKVETDVGDAGYILVNVNLTDILVPQLATIGTTICEELKTAAGDEKAKIYRYSHLDFAAETLNRSGEGTLAAVRDGNGIRSVIGTRSQADENERYQQFRKGFTCDVQDAGSYPFYNRDVLQQYYAEDDTRAPEPKPKKYTTQLKHSYIAINGTQQRTAPHGQTRIDFTDDDIDWGAFFTLNWGNLVNTTHSTTMPVGCGPTAWSIVYAYWKDFKGKTELFDGGTTGFSFSNDVRKAQVKIAKKMGTWHFDDLWNIIPTSENGLTWPDDFYKGEQYARSFGYGTSVKRVNAYVWFDWDRDKAANWVYKYIEKDWPVVALFNTDNKFGDYFPTHYSVVEKAVKYQIKGTSDVKELGMYLNYGGGSVKKGGLTGEFVYYITHRGKSTLMFWDFYTVSIWDK